VHVIIKSGPYQWLYTLHLLTVKLYIMHAYPPLGVSYYTKPTGKALSNTFDLQVESYYAEDYETSQVEEFCARFLVEKGFLYWFSLILTMTMVMNQCTLKYTSVYDRAYVHSRILEDILIK